MGAITNLNTIRRVMGNKQIVQGSFIMSASYDATNGDSGLNPTALGFDHIDLVYFDKNARFNIYWDPTNNNVKCYYYDLDATSDSGAVTIPNATNLTDTGDDLGTIRFTAIGN